MCHICSAISGDLLKERERTLTCIRRQLLDMLLISLSLSICLSLFLSFLISFYLPFAEKKSRLGSLPRKQKSQFYNAHQGFTYINSHSSMFSCLQSYTKTQIYKHGLILLSLFLFFFVALLLLNEKDKGMKRS